MSRVTKYYTKSVVATDLKSIGICAELSFPRPDTGRTRLSIGLPCKRKPSLNGPPHSFQIFQPTQKKKEVYKFNQQLAGILKALVYAAKNFLWWDRFSFGASRHWFTERKNGVILTWKVESLTELKFHPGFRVIGEYWSPIDPIFESKIDSIFESKIDSIFESKIDLIFES